METLHPELWKEIFTDGLYIINEKVSSTENATIPIPETQLAQPTLTSASQVFQSPTLPGKTEKASQTVSDKAESVNKILKPEGTYSNGVLILIHESLAMTPVQKEMLTKIVKAVQLNLSECGVLQTAVPVSLKELETLNPRFLLSFGIPKDAFKPDLQKEYYAIQKHNSTIILLADALGSLEKNDTLKRSLWNTLKDMFGIK
jgi:hypothetical protein